MPKEIITKSPQLIPGGLVVSRSFGDARAKVPQLGGNPKVLVSAPEIKSFKIKSTYDFIIIGSKGVYNTMSNTDIMRCVLEAMKTKKVCSRTVELIIGNALLRRSIDSITAIMLRFKDIINQRIRKSRRAASLSIANKAFPLTDTKRKASLSVVGTVDDVKKVRDMKQ